jgi:hypothetical protein
MGTESHVFSNNKSPGDMGADAWIQTYSGKYFHYLEDNPQNIKIEDIAHGLSNLCRYSGQCNSLYTVAQHCCIVSDLAEKGFRLEGLMHDAAEAYMGDIPRPVKNLVPEIKILEKKVFRQIAKEFNLKYPISSVIELLDTRVMLAEARIVLKEGTVWCVEGITPADINLNELWEPKKAEMEFLTRFNTLNGQTVENIPLKYGVSF